MPFSKNSMYDSFNVVLLKNHKKLLTQLAKEETQRTGEKTNLSQLIRLAIKNLLIEKGKIN